MQDAVKSWSGRIVAFKRLTLTFNILLSALMLVPTRFLFAFLFITGFASADTFSTWQASHFTGTQLGNASISGPGANPDGDGFPNLMEYAFALDPLIANRGNEALAQSFVGRQFAWSYV